MNQVQGITIEEREVISQVALLKRRARRSLELALHQEDTGINLFLFKKNSKEGELKAVSPDAIRNRFTGFFDFLDVLDGNIPLEDISKNAAFYAIADQPSLRSYKEGIPEIVFCLANIWGVERDEVGPVFTTLRCVRAHSFTRYRIDELMNLIQSH